MSADLQEPAQHGRRWRMAGVGLAVAAVIVLAVGFAARYQGARELRERAAERALPIVAVAQPTPGGDPGALELPGRVEAYARAPIYARVGGYLKSWHADIGARVKAGQLLAVIETPELDQQLLQAEAELANARANAALAQTTADRWQSLLGTDSVSRQEVEEKNADLAAKLSLVRALQANVERYAALKRFARIVAPFDGIVTARSTDVGDLVAAGGAQGRALFVVSDTSRARVYVNVPQNFTAVMTPGLTATVTVPGRPENGYGATVQSQSQAIDVASGTMLVQLMADNEEAQLLPGQFARVRFELPTAPGALTVPSSALIVGKDGLRIATVGANDAVVLKPVTLARDSGATIDIASGLDPTDRVIVNPPDGLVDGDRVRVATADETAGKAAHGKS